MHGYLSNGHLNSLSKFNYEKVRRISSLRPLLDQPWITNKIYPNVVKVGVHSYLPNVQINLRSNFNFEKLVKSETLLFGFTKVWLKGCGNISECHENFHARLFIQWDSKSMIKFQFWEVGQKWKSIVQFFLGFGLKEVKIALNMGKVCVHACLPNGNLNLWLNFNFEKLVKSETR